MAKLTIVSFMNEKQGWIPEALETYRQKISFFTDFEFKHLKTPKLSRDQQAVKKDAESKILREFIDRIPGARVVIMDQNAKLKTSLQFSQWLSQRLETSKQVLCVIGGAYGLSNAIKERANDSISLSPLTFSHPLAEVILAEQVYRALSILKNTPYHNS